MDKKIRSAVFSEYNKAKRALDSSKRTDKALGLIFSNEYHLKIKQYGTTIRHCACPDQYHRGGICYHRRALMILHRTHKPKDGKCYHAYRIWKFHPSEDYRIEVCTDCGKIMNSIKLGG